MEDEPVFLAKEEVRTLCYSSFYLMIMRRNYSIMRPTVFSANRLRQFLRRNRVATLPQLKQLLGTQADITVFRKLKELSYRTSYSHRGSFYTLDEIAVFDARGLWSFDSVSVFSLRHPGGHCGSLRDAGSGWLFRFRIGRNLRDNPGNDLARKDGSLLFLFVHHRRIDECKIPLPGIHLLPGLLIDHRTRQHSMG